MKGMMGRRNTRASGPTAPPREDSFTRASSAPQVRVRTLAKSQPIRSDGLRADTLEEDRKRMRILVPAVLGFIGFAALAACSDDPTVATEEVVLLRVDPPGGSVAVNPGTQVVLTFDRAIRPSMAEYAALHEGTVIGPEVGGTWSLTQDGTVLTFTPAEPLKAATIYAIHLGGGMEGVHGEPMNLDMHGATHMGGQWATGSVMSGGMGGMAGGHPHMGEGWQDPNGTYGMVFTFTTGN